jgi:subtilisin family serine protease
MICAVVLVSAIPVHGQDRSIRRARRPIPNQYIVVLASADDAEAVGLESQSLYRGRLRHVYRQGLRGFSIRLDAASAEALARDPRVRFVEEDGIAEISDVQVGPPSWGLDRIDQRALPLDARYAYPPFATPVHVHVVDTGIRASHLEFGPRAFVAGDYIDDDGDGDPNDVGNDDANPGTPDGADCHGHGTHVAATIAGASYGIAKNAIVHAYRALDCAGRGPISGIIAAIDAITADGRRPAVANMSLGGDPSPALDDAVRRSIGAGITYAIAAGNSNVDASGASPARVAEAITVGATNSSDQRAGFSNFGASLDVFAPGVGILSAWIGSDSATATASGTSMASPHVAGVAALYLEQVGNKTPLEVRNAIVAAASTGLIGNPGTGSPNALLYSGFTLPPPANTPPTVSLTSPAEGATALAPASFTVTATAADAEGPVSSVAFYANGTLLIDDTTSPFSVTWTAVPAGAYTLIAVATDAGGLATTAAPVHVIVTSPPPPPGTTRVNVALAATGATATASSVYAPGFGADAVINGERRGERWGVNGFWQDATGGVFNDWVEVAFNGPQTIDQLDVVFAQDSSATVDPTPTLVARWYGVTEFTLQYWTGATWAAVPGGVIRGNTLVWRTVSFAPLTTSRVRILFERPQDNWSRLVEFEAYSTGGTPAPSGSEWFVAQGGFGDGSSANPFGRIQDALNAAQAADTVTVRPGTYNERLTTVRAGAPGAAITLRSASGRGSVLVTSSGRVLTVGHEYFVVDGVTLDGQYGADDLVRVGTAAHYLQLKNSELRRSSRDLIDMGAPTGVLIEGCLIHHALNPIGGRSDAHGVVAGAIHGLTIRDSEIHTFSGDGVQVDAGRAAPGWDGLTIERTRIWLAPLPAAENGFPAGVAPGENAVDTKSSASYARATVVLRDMVAYGFRNGFITNMAAFNLKENVDVTVDGVTVFDSEIAFRLRGAVTGGAWVAIKNAVVHDVLTAFRYEDNIQNLRVWNNTVGANVTQAFQAASSVSTGLEVRNLLLLGTLSLEAAHPSNLGVDASVFTNAAAHDYTLSPMSPAIDAGVVLSQVTTDRIGVARPQGAGVDVGAFERP